MNFCLHCEKREAAQGWRGLCRPCHRRKKIRLRYQTVKPCGRHPEVPYTGPPTEATPHRSGTQEKMAVMQERAARGQGLFHPQDGRLA